MGKMNIYRILRYLCVWLFVFLFIPSLAAQTEEEVYNEKVVVISGYQPVLQESEKINVSPKITDTSNLSPEFNYQIHPLRIYSLFSPGEIQAARLVGEPSIKLYKSYIKAGMGSYFTPLVDLYFNSTKSESLNYSARLYHNSSWWSLADYGSNWFSNTSVDLYGKYIWNKTFLSANVFYKNDYNLYYGFSDSTLNLIYPEVTRDQLSKSDYSQVYNHVGGIIDFGTISLDKLFYKTGLKFENLSDHYGINELHFNLGGDINYGFDWFGKDKQKLGLKVDWDIYNNSYDTLYPYSYIGNAQILDSSSLIYNILNIHPYFKFKFSGFDLNLGMSMFLTTRDTFKIIPYIVLSQQFMDGAFAMRMGVVGDVDRNSWQSLRMVNPYIGPNAEISNTSYYNYFLETDFAIMNNMDLGFGISYRTFENAPIFLIDSTYMLNTVYKPIYVDYDLLQVGAKFNYRLTEYLNVGLTANYYNYDLSDDSLIEEVLYKPNFDLNLNALYNYGDKLKFSLNALVLGNMNGLYFANDQACYEKMPLKYGIDLKVEYQYMRALSFFVTFDNVAFQRYFYWTNYPSQKFRLLLGFTYTVPTL